MISPLRMKQVSLPLVLRQSEAGDFANAKWKKILKGLYILINLSQYHICKVVQYSNSCEPCANFESSS